MLFIAKMAPIYLKLQAVQFGSRIVIVTCQPLDLKGPYEVFLFFLRVCLQQTNFGTASSQSKIFGFDFDFYQQLDARIEPRTAG